MLSRLRLSTRGYGLGIRRGGFGGLPRGASALAELPAFGLPAILVPYPYAWRYQKVNADYLAGGARRCASMTKTCPARLGNTVLALLGDDQRMAQMRANSRALATVDGAAKLAALLVEVGGG